MFLATVLFLLLSAVASIYGYEVIECRNGFEATNRESTGEIISPGYQRGERYPNNVQCGFMLTAPMGYYMKLTFLDLDIESSNMCSADLVHVDTFDYRSDRSVLCGRMMPNPFVSQLRKIKVFLRTDDMRTAKGFRARFEAVERRTVCNSTSEFMCNDRTCVSGTAKCDGVFDCPDASDEDQSICGRSKKIPLIPNSSQCGKTPIKPDTDGNTPHAMMPRIINGRIAVENSWPWQVSLEQTTAPPHSHFCGGSLINNYWILTAAHCMPKDIGDRMFIRFGAHDLNQQTSKEQWRRAKKVIPHEKFTMNDMSYDIGLILLDNPVNYTNTVQPVCLPTGKDIRLPVNETCFSSGWGSTRGSGFSGILKQTVLHVSPNNECEKEDFDIPFTDPDSKVCATELDGFAGPCHGDSGGPFVCQQTNGTWTLHGATSFGTMTTGTEAVCGMGTHTVWNRVAFHLSWIENIIRRES